MKYAILKISERNGEYESLNYYTLRIKKSITAKQLDKFMRNWRGAFDYEEDKHYYFNSGQIVCTVESYQEIPKEDYEILNKYI